MAQPEILSEALIRQALEETRAIVFSPTSCYRLQMNKNFTFDHACAILEYLHDLGIDAVYLSPIFQAVPGSLHGYDVADPSKINAELGGEEGFKRFCHALKKRGMGLILDVVPNHMGISGSNNPWWQDVLENGPSSQHAHFFDIDWIPVKKELQNKVLLPFLGNQYGVVLESGELQLRFFEGQFVAGYGPKHFPIAPDTYPQILEHEIENLKAQLPATDLDLHEYLSILGALKSLPRRSDPCRIQAQERAREKEVLKRRLNALVERSSVIRNFIDSRLALFNGVCGSPRSYDLLDQLLELQSYRLAYWKVAAEEINYRRFFDINDLAAIRMEEEGVFQCYHQRIFELIAQGWVQGLRIDHPDGLYDPAAYFKKLQEAYLNARLRQKIAVVGEELSDELLTKIREAVEVELRLGGAPLYIVIEKILERTEELPDDWPVSGTVGYEYLNALNGIFVKQENEAALTEVYEKFSGMKVDFESLLYEKKKFFAAFNMSSEINALAHRLNLISEKVRRYRDFTLSNLATAIREVIACFPVYRTYIRAEDSAVSARDTRYIEECIERAIRKHPALSPAIFYFLKQVLLGRFEDAFSDEERRMLREFVLKFQQITGPIMAKGMEDTLFYIYNRLLSLNEVGGDPVYFGYDSFDFHKQNLLRKAKWPHALITTSTHDTKRSEDVRMRLNVLSEVPVEWGGCLYVWSQMGAKWKTQCSEGIFPDKNMEYFIYQTLVGVWPYSLEEGQLVSLKERVSAYCLKAARESKTYTNWHNPNLEYENALRVFLDGIFSESESGEFFSSFRAFHRRIADSGLFNALSALALKAGSPGVPDFYQGGATWDYSLVDPDNRRQVDFDLRVEKLAEVKQLYLSQKKSAEKLCRELMQTKEDGRIKILAVWRLLNLRRQNEALFIRGDYIPITIEGPQKKQVVAFARKLEESWAIFSCVRFLGVEEKEFECWPLDEKKWGETVLILPDSLDGVITKGSDYLTKSKIKVSLKNEKQVLRAFDLFGNMNFSILTNLDVD